MKSLKTSATALLLMVVFLLLISCKKEQSSSGSQQQDNSASVAKPSGVIDDDPQFVSRIPFIISSDLLHRSSSGAATVSGSSNVDLSSLEKSHRPKPISGGGGGGGDVTAPSVSITSPTQGQTIDPTTISVSVSASDNVGVTSVSLSINGSVQGTLTGAPYNFTWNASTYSGTSPTLTATATDAAGNSNSFTITVAINANVVVLPPAPSSLPSSFELVTPPVGNQGNEWVCVPFATAYAARSIEQYYRTGASSYSYSTNIFSPEYVYDQTKFSDCGSGTAITTTLDLMKNKGVCLWGTLPYDDMNGCDASIATPYDGQAAVYRISSYGKLVNNDLTGIKTMLVNNHPVIASLALDNSFLNAGPGFIWSTYSGSGGAGHTLIICGYDDSKQAYKVMSSWGTGWGDAGYSWISYSFFPTRAGYYVYVMNY
jgi:Big-like domain-containing protein/papain like protease